jgi:hypothetical protein
MTQALMFPASGSECYGLFSTVENQFKPEAAHFPFVSDQAQTSPLGRRLCWNIPRCSVTDPSWGWTIEDEQCQKIGGGYKALKFRFLLFL